MSAQLAAPLGHYVDTTGATSFKRANPGYYVPATGSALPSPAAPGSYVPLSGASEAIPAPIGTYVPQPASSFAIPAPAGYTTYVAGSTFFQAIPDIQLTAYTLNPGGSSSFSFTTASGQSYGIFMSDDLNTWIEIESVPGTGDIVTKSLTAPGPGSPKRFFRIVATPTP